MYDTHMQSALLSQIQNLVGQLDVAVDGDELAAVFRLREALLAKSMTPLHEFDAAGLYQLSHARSTAAFLERSAGLAPGDAGAIAKMARRLAVMAETRARFEDGALSSGQIRAIVATVSPRVQACYTANETEIVKMLEPLTVRDTIVAMQSWAAHAHALVDDDDDTPPRKDEYFHSETLDGRFESKGSFAAVGGTIIDTALRVAQDDHTRRDGLSPAERRAEALVDVSPSTSTTATAPTPTLTRPWRRRSATGRISSASSPPTTWARAPAPSYSAVPRSTRPPSTPCHAPPNSGGCSSTRTVRFATTS
jgi:hypothetical protein